MRNLPLLVIVAQIDGENAFSEHHVFTGLNKPDFLYKTTGYRPGRNVSDEDFKEFVTLETLLASEFDYAKANLEYSVFEMDKDLHHKLLWEGQNFEYHEVDDTAFVRLALRKECKKAIVTMFGSTYSQALGKLEKKWKILSQLDIK